MIIDSIQGILREAAGALDALDRSLSDVGTQSDMPAHLVSQLRSSFRQLENVIFDPMQLLASNRDLPMDGFYFLRAAGILNIEGDPEYTEHLALRASGQFALSHQVQCDLARASVEPGWARERYREITFAAAPPASTDGSAG